jgi:hypothetical protein
MEENAEERARDYYFATLEEGSLVMEPHCGCGNPLGEKYFCEKCNRQCLCEEILCDSETTLDHVKNLIGNNEMFKSFTARLVTKK